jgi:hypothetical protein
MVCLCPLLVPHALNQLRHQRRAAHLYLLGKRRRCRGHGGRRGDRRPASSGHDPELRARQCGEPADLPRHVFRIPLLLICTHRGAPGVKDEPQHELMGRITGRLFDTMELPWEPFPTAPDARAAALWIGDAEGHRGPPCPAPGTEAAGGEFQSGSRIRLSRPGTSLAQRCFRTRGAHEPRSVPPRVRVCGSTGRYPERGCSASMALRRRTTPPSCSPLRNRRGRGDAVELDLADRRVAGARERRLRRAPHSLHHQMLAFPMLNTTTQTSSIFFANSIGCHRESIPPLAGRQRGGG